MVLLFSVWQIDSVCREVDRTGIMPMTKIMYTTLCLPVMFCVFVKQVADWFRKGKMGVAKTILEMSIVMFLLLMMMAKSFMLEMTGKMQDSST